MRKLTLQEVRLPAGGSTEEFSTLVRHVIPRWNEPPNHWTLSPDSPAETRPVSPPDTVAQQTSVPVPLHWLPRRDEWPEVF